RWHFFNRVGRLLGDDGPGPRVIHDRLGEGLVHGPARQDGEIRIGGRGLRVLLGGGRAAPREGHHNRGDGPGNEGTGGKRAKRRTSFDLGRIGGKSASFPGGGQIPRRGLFASLPGAPTGRYHPIQAASSPPLENVPMKLLLIAGLLALMTCASTAFADGPRN